MDTKLADSFWSKYLGLSGTESREVEGLVIDASPSRNLVTMRNMKFDIVVLAVRDGKIVQKEEMHRPTNSLEYYITYDIKMMDGCDYIVELPANSQAVESMREGDSATVNA